MFISDNIINWFHSLTIYRLFFIWFILQSFINFKTIDSNYSSRSRICLERIWPDFQRCRDRQREHHQFGRFSSGFFFTSTDVYQPKYKVECCSYWELLECVHRAAKIYCTDDDVDLKKLDQALETFGLNVPLYICTEEYPKGSLRCKIRSWFIMTIVFSIFCILVLIILVCICLRRTR